MTAPFQEDLTVNLHLPSDIAASKPCLPTSSRFRVRLRLRRCRVDEFAERVRRIRREAVVAGHDALIVHTDMVGWFHTSNAYLRYVCDWMREGVLIIPTDSDKEMVLLSFFTQSVILPPGGEPVGGRARSGRSARSAANMPTARARRPRRPPKPRQTCSPASGLASGQIGRLGDRTSPAQFWAISKH